MEIKLVVDELTLTYLVLTHLKGVGRGGQKILLEVQRGLCTNFKVILSEDS